MAPFSKRILEDLKQKQRAVFIKLQKAHAAWQADPKCPTKRAEMDKSVKAIAEEILTFLCEDYAGQNADDIANMLKEWREPKPKDLKTKDEQGAKGADVLRSDKNAAEDEYILLQKFVESLTLHDTIPSTS